MEISSSSSRRIEITVLSGEDLRIDRRSVKKNAFVIVQTDAFNCWKTSIDELGGSHPSWNEKFSIDLPMNVRFVTLQVQCKTSSGNRSIGSANVPVSDFVGGYVPDNYLHFLSYRLRDPKGDKNGIINVSVRVKTPEYGTRSSKPPGFNVQGYAACSSQSAVGQGYASYSSSAGFRVPGRWSRERCSCLVRKPCINLLALWT
ncbi:BON1-associated protein 2-like [Melia azedarach]|uniref:BON1-associated protein 2-like n=1 Tax=Melia azedarach TaxID=155640 RepID=A0ACC1YU85_MELAZ|nr:BON1-associated protein 2-like [Melia azedarach]